jgi:hypothetical protein
MTDVDWNFREMLHHGAEIALLRDLYRWHFDGKGA